ncbi:hypothetical protein CHLNCDRAFT_144129 [Chlorella variabilis]|uniref:Uncharacterized protein n=1 Tax=Chlorella variabilis TaxID=554065 RepID=E1ZBZ2_CHLVA|nr:hypothetical protein CHLNCDRAFT_144129 [Chlorella variabilis]EFN56721.1 hypothetical protein CHLNCDRAFT_144129 [Chlorella variabilis]|eukprot:XP_005848823.1 hypothetical protein CHLNCDRAFT_144129 [Chlorella variabilis]
MAARQLDTSGAAEVAVHLVPALIEHNGPAAVNAYFRPQESGVCLPLPDGFSGAVIECRQQDAAEQADGSQGGAAGALTSWVATGGFSHLHYYNHDSAPLKGDGLRRCLEWAELSAQVHRAVDPAAVAAAIAAVDAAPAAATAMPQAG